MRSPSRILLIIPVLLLAAVLLGVAENARAGQTFQPAPSSTPGYDRPGPIPTVYPPSQADNGAQIYWSMCQDCHGDQGQGLTAAWRSAFAPAYQDCWASGCHGEDAPQGSFLIPGTGAPALAGPGALTRFATAFELGTFIQSAMPLAPTGAMTSNQAWELTAYLLSLNGTDTSRIELSGRTGAALSLHRELSLPESSRPGTLLLALVLFLAAVGVGRSLDQEPVPGKKTGRENFYHHLHPPRIPAQQARLGFTLGAGGLAVFFCLILLVTGALEMYYYVPTPDGAGPSIQVITSLVPYGKLVRNLHYWSAQFLVIAVMAHLVRVILTGAYAPPRRFNYLLGLVLLVLVLLLDFTGYVLRWDEGIRWALVVGTNLIQTIPGIGEGLYRFLMGGSQPGLAALTRFYSWHIYGLTLLAAIIIAWHIFKVRRDGGISSPPPPRNQVAEKIPRAQLVKKEVLAMLIAGGILLLISALLPAPLDQPITDNSSLTGDSRAPWFFLWIQETLKWGDPFWWGVALPLAAVLILGLLPYLLPNAPEEEWGRWLPKGNRAGQILGILIIAGIFILTLIGWLR